MKIKKVYEAKKVGNAALDVANALAHKFIDISNFSHCELGAQDSDASYMMLYLTSVDKHDISNIDKMFDYLFENGYSKGKEWLLIGEPNKTSDRDEFKAFVGVEVWVYPDRLNELYMALRKPNDLKRFDL